MANTTNFNWETPDDTDLVKDGAAAIRTLAGAIDTSLVDLKGGTTDQVLAKNSGTDMDFKWVADASGIPATIFDAKGDIIAASDADTAARLAVGANDTVLTADSSTATGLKWAAPVSGALTLLSATTFSGSSAHSVNDVFSATYDNYFLLLNIDSTSGVDGYINLRLRVSGSDNSSNNYYWSLVANTSSASTYDGNISNGAVSSFNIYYAQDTDEAATATLELKNPFVTDRTTYNHRAVYVRSSASHMHHGGGGTTVTTSYTGFTILTSGGTMTGSVKVYGYVNS